MSYILGSLLGVLGLLSYLRVFIYNLKESLFAESERWFIWIPVFFTFGCGFYFSFSFEPSKWIILFLLELFLVVIFIYRKQNSKLVVLFFLFIFTIGFAVACLHTYYVKTSIFPIEKEEITYIKGQIYRIEHNYRGKQRIVLQNMMDYDDVKIKGKYSLTLMTNNNELKNGDYVEMIANISPITKPFLVGGYRPNRVSFFAGISANGYVSSSVLRLDDYASSPPSIFDDFYFLINNLRRNISNKISTVLKKDDAGVVSAIMVGERGGISVPLNEAYRDSGLAHFLSISGLHMSMLTGLMFFFVRSILVLFPYLVNRFNSKKIAAVCSLVMSFIYLLLSGMEIPAQRAFIMTSIVLIGVLLDRKAISMRVISIAAFVVLLISPSALLSPSFQMSFSATIVLIAFYERYSVSIRKFVMGDCLYNSSKWGMFIRICWIYVLGILLTDLVASVTTSVFAVHHFNRLAIYTTIGNLLSGPIIGFIIMPFLLLSLIFMPFGLSYIPLKITGLGVSFVNDIVKDVSALPHSSILLPSFSSWGLVLMVIGGLWVCIWQTNWRNFGWVFIFIGFISVFFQNQPDIIVNEDVSVVAVKDSSGDLVVLPSRGKHTLKRIWQEKTASRFLREKEKKQLKMLVSEGKDVGWLDLKCGNKYCDYRNLVRIYKDGRLYDLSIKKFFKLESGGSIWIEKNHLKIITIDEYIGNRFF